MHFVASVAAIVRAVAQFVARDAHTVVARELDALVAAIRRFIATIATIRMAVALERNRNALQRLLAPELRFGALDAAAMLWIFIAAIQTRGNTVAQRRIPYASIAVATESHFAQIRAVQFGVAWAVICKRFIGSVATIIVAVTHVFLVDTFVEVFAPELIGPTRIQYRRFRTDRCTRQAFRFLWHKRETVAAHARATFGR